jgi:hypothetical protein
MSFGKENRIGQTKGKKAISTYIINENGGKTKVKKCAWRSKYWFIARHRKYHWRGGTPLSDPCHEASNGPTCLVSKLSK